MFLFLLFPFLLIHHSEGQAKCSGKCKELTSLYEDINCVPLYDQPGDCCPVNFDCSHLLTKPKTDCILQGKLYKVGQEVPRDETYGSCQIGCHCTNGDTGLFTCAVLDCPEHLGNSPPNNCTSKYELDKCCAVGKVCPPFDNLAKCEVDGQTYYEGQKFQPANEKCLSCVCQKGFKGDFVKPFCQKVKCLTELRNSVKLQENCAVVYISGNECCPYTFICPEDHPFTIKKAKSVNGQLSCLFGQEILGIGDSFEKSETFAGYHTIQTKCECRTPPFVTCIEKNIYDPEKTPEHIKKYLNL